MSSIGYSPWHSGEILLQGWFRISVFAVAQTLESTKCLAWRHQHTAPADTLPHLLNWLTHCISRWYNSRRFDWNFACYNPFFSRRVSDCFLFAWNNPEYTHVGHPSCNAAFDWQYPSPCLTFIIVLTLLGRRNVLASKHARYSRLGGV